MDASEFNRICGVLDELIKDLNILDDVFGEDLYNLLSNDTYRDGFIKHYARKIRKEVDYNKEEDVWDRIRRVTSQTGVNWQNMRVGQLMAIVQNYTEEKAVEKINNFDKDPEICCRE